MKNSTRLFYSIWVFCFSFLDATESFDLELNIRKVTYYQNLDLFYLNIPKNASSFLRSVIACPFFNDNIANYSNEIKRSTKLLVIRHPYSRVISIYFEVIKCRIDGPGNIPSYSFYKKRDKPCISFLEFLLTIKENLIDRHCLAQHMFLDSKGLTLDDIDYIIDFDHLEEDFRRFSNKYDIPTQFESVYINESPTDIKETLQDYLQNNAEARAIVDEIYEQDFILYEQAMRKRAIWIQENT